VSLLPILLWPDPRLRRVCAPVEAFDDLLRQLAHDMLETMYAASGRGLAAPQVGILQRLFVMDADWKTGAPRPVVMVNPRVLSVGAELAVTEEGCLSIPGVLADVRRPVSVRLAWQDLDGGDQEADLTGFEATCAQHELDHLDGLVTLDRLDPAARAAAEAAYAA
jgi:peptide deformylase